MPLHFVEQAVSTKKFVVKISISADTLKNKHKLIEHIFILFISENQEIFLSNFNESSGLNRLKKYLYFALTECYMGLTLKESRKD
jgi:hypothetical protein